MLKFYKFNEMRHIDYYSAGLQPVCLRGKSQRKQTYFTEIYYTYHSSARWHRLLSRFDNVFDSYDG